MAKLINYRFKQSLRALKPSIALLTSQMTCGVACSNTWQ